MANKTNSLFDLGKKTVDTKTLDDAQAKRVSLFDLKTSISPPVELPREQPDFDRPNKVVSKANDLGVSYSQAEVMVDQKELAEQTPKDERAGFWDAAGRDIEEKLPFSPAGAAKALTLFGATKRLAATNPETAYTPLQSKVGQRVSRFAASAFAGAGTDAPFNTGRPDISIEQLRQSDIDFLDRFFEEQANRQKQGLTFMGKVGAASSEMPKWMIEFMATGGLNLLASNAAKRFVGKRIKSELVKRAAGVVAGAAARTTVGLPHSVAESILMRRISEDSENWATSVAKGWGSVFIEALSEESGAAITGILSKGIAKMPLGSKMIEGLHRAWTSISPKNTTAKFVKQVFTKAGYSNLIGELGEERLATVLHAIAETETFGLGNDAGVLDRLSAGLKQDIENLPVEGVVLSIPGTGRFALGKVSDAFDAQKGKKEDGKTSDASPKQVSSVSESLAEDQGKKSDEGQVIDPATAEKLPKKEDPAPVSDLSGPITPEVLQQIFDEQFPEKVTSLVGPIDTAELDEQIKGENIHLGLGRKPVFNKSLESMTDNQFEKHKDLVDSTLNDLEKTFDENPNIVDTDLEFRNKLAIAQDEFSSAEIEHFRRNVDVSFVDDIVRDFMGLSLSHDNDKLKAAILLNEVKKQGVESEFMQELGKRSEVSSDHAELVEAQLKEAKGIIDGLIEIQDAPIFKTTMFQGRGASLEDVYGDQAVKEGRAVPILGAGQYFTFNEADAKNFGKTSSHDVSIKNPLVIDSDKLWFDLLKTADTPHLNSAGFLFYEDPKGIPAATEKLKDYVVSQGYDGIVIKNTDDNKRLRESFGHDQVVVYESLQDQEAKPKTEGTPVRPPKSELNKTKALIGAYEPYQAAQQEVIQKVSVLGLGPFYVDPVNRADVEQAIGQVQGFKTALQKAFVFEKGEGIAWDTAAENAGLEISEISTFVETVRDFMAVNKGQSVIMEGVVDLVRDQGDPYFEAILTKYDMLRQKNVSVQEVNRALGEVADQAGIERSDLSDLYVPDTTVPMDVGGATAAERQVIAAQIREFAKAQGIEFSRAELEQAIDAGISRAQEFGRKVGFKAGEVAKQQDIVKIEDRHQKRVNKLEQRIAEVQEFARDRQQAFKDRQNQTEADREQAQRELIKYVQKNLPLRERGKLLAQIKNIRSDRDLRNAMEMANRLSEQYNQRLLREKIALELKRGAPRTQGGKAKGKFTAEIQQSLDHIQFELDFGRVENREEIRKDIGELVEKLQDSSVSLKEQGRVLEEINKIKYHGFNGMYAKELQGVLDDIIEIKKNGRVQARIKQLERLERIAAYREDFVAILSGGKGLKPGTESLPGEQLNIDKPVLGWTLGLSHWGELMDMLSVRDKGTKPGESELSNVMRELVWTPTNAEALGVSEVEQEIFDGAKEIFGETFDKDIMHLSDEITIGPVQNFVAQNVTLKMTRDAAIKKYMEMQDPTLDATFVGGISDEGDTWGMLWSDSVMQSVTDSLSAKEKKWAHWQLDFYRRYYNTVNEVYRRVYGVDLPFNPFYSPINRDVVGGEVPEIVAMAQDRMNFANPTNRSLKVRQGSIKKLKFVGATETMLYHVRKMEHFKAWAESMNELRSIFRDTEITTAIKQFSSIQAVREIHYHIDSFARGGTAMDQTKKWMNTLRGNITGALIARPSVPFKQPLSLPVYVNLYGQNGLAGMADFLQTSDGKTPMEKFEWMRDNNQLLRNRWAGGHERDIKDMLKQNWAREMTGRKSLIKVMSSFAIHQFDKGTTVLGTWSGYQNYKKAGMSDIDALNRAAIDTFETQPSSELPSLSRFQTESSWSKLWTTFSNQPIKYLNMLNGAIRNLKAGRGSKIKNAWTIVYVWSVAPMLFQFVSDAFRWDEERQLRAVLLGPINYIPIINGFAKKLISANTGGKWYAGGTGSPTVDTLVKITDSTVRVTRKLTLDGVTLDEFIEAIELLAEAGGTLTGLPTPYLVDVEQAIREGDLPGIIFSKYSRGIDKTKKKSVKQRK